MYGSAYIERSALLKILFLTRSLEWGGAERQLVALARQLAERGFDVVVAAFYRKSRMDEGMEDTGIRVVSLDKRGRWDLIGFSRRLIDLVGRERPDVVHSYLTGPNVLSALLKRRFRNARLVWGVRSSFMDLARYDRVSRLAAWAEAQLASIPDLIICNSGAGMREAERRGFPPRRMRLIPNGIDTTQFTFSREKRRAFRERWGVPADVVLVGLVARQDPMKDVETFVHAAGVSLRLRPELRFVGIGRGLTGSDLVPPQGLQFVESQTDMPGVFSALDILCSSSIGEGFSNVIAEAMSCERPCVVTDVGDSAWIVGDTGFVVPARDPQRLGEAIVRMADAELGQRGQDARQRVVEMFGLARLGETTAQVLADL